MENFPTNTSKVWWLEGKKKAFWRELCMCFSECGSTITIKAQIMRINVCKKLFTRSVRRRSMMHIFMVLCKSFLIFFFRLFFYPRLYSGMIRVKKINSHRLKKVFQDFFSRSEKQKTIHKNAQKRKKTFWQSAWGKMRREKTRTICDSLTSSQNIAII